MTDDGKKLPQYVAALSATGGALAAGTILAWTAPTESAIKNGAAYDFEVTDEAFSWIGALTPLGAASICIPIGFLANIFGRKWTMLGLVVPFTVGWASLIWAPNLGTLLFARFILGVSGGAFCVTAPMYTGEIAQSSIRGALGSYFQLMVTVGILFVNVLGATGISTFQLSLICAMIPLVFGVIFFFMPESPAYLVKKDKNEEAGKALKTLRGDKYDCDKELCELKAEEDSLRANSLTLGESFALRSTKKATFIALGLMLFQQFSGINAVIFYTNKIFEAAGTGIKETTATMIVGVVQVLATFASSLIVDKLGRKILLLGSSLVMGICQIVLGTFFYLKLDKNMDLSSYGMIPIVALCIVFLSFSLGFGPIPWMICGELFAPNVKALLGASAGTLNWTLAFFVTKFFSNLVTAIHIGPVFWLFSVWCLLGFIFVLFVVPETKGMSLVDIQRMLNGEKVEKT